MDPEDLLAVVDSPESETLDFKLLGASPEPVVRAAVAMANTSGGTIVVGVDDHRRSGRARLDRVKGVQNAPPERLAATLQALRREIRPPISGLRHYTVEVPVGRATKRSVVIVDVPKSNRVHSDPGGRILRRLGASDVTLDPEQVVSLAFEKGERSAERQPATSASLDDLDLELIELYRRARGSTETDLWTVLIREKFAERLDEGPCLLWAPVLLFGHTPARTLGTRCGVTIARVEGEPGEQSPALVEQPVYLSDNLAGLLPKAFSLTMEMLGRIPPRLRGPAFVRTRLPEFAVQEVIANALVHRDYFHPDDVQIRVGPDWLMVRSPGPLPPPVTLETITSVRSHRNPIIGDSLRVLPDSPLLDLGEGVQRVFASMKSRSLLEPAYSEPDRRYVNVTLFDRDRTPLLELLLEQLRRAPSVSNSEARKLLGVTDTLKMSRLLAEWERLGYLERIGTSKKSTRYRRKGAALIELRAIAEGGGDVHGDLS
jgi:ATP-dependent DNA helicase RecG